MIDHCLRYANFFATFPQPLPQTSISSRRKNNVTFPAFKVDEHVCDPRPIWLIKFEIAGRAGLSLGYRKTAIDSFLFGLRSWEKEGAFQNSRVRSLNHKSFPICFFACAREYKARNPTSRQAASPFAKSNPGTNRLH
jgi:hypothetical protein